MLLALSILAISLRLSVAETSSFTKTYVYPETRITPYCSAADDRNFVYARCNSSLVPEEGMKCIVGIKFDAFDDTNEFTKECEVTLKPEISYKIINLRLRSLDVYGFGKDKVLLVWGQIARFGNRWMDVKTTVVHVFDGCRNFEVKVKRYHANLEFHYMEVRPAVVIFKDTYELIIKHCPYVALNVFGCESADHDVYKFDSYNQKLSELENWPYPPKNYNDIFMSIEFEPRKYRYVMSVCNHPRFAVALMNKRSQNYERQDIFEMSSDEHRSFGACAITLTNKAIGFGLILNDENSRVVFGQADQDGKIYLKKEFAFQYPYEAMLESMYNRRKGGFLLAVSKYNKTAGTDESYWFEGDVIYLIRVDEKGQLDSVDVHVENRCPVHLGGFGIVRLFENEKDEYCIARQCQSNVPVRGRLETTVHCYSSDEFSRCDDCITE